VSLRRIPLPALAFSSLVLVTTALVFVFFVAPNDQTLGFSQRIFYFHVSLAFTAYACFAGGAWQAFRHLWKRDPRADLASYVCVHQGLIFGTMVLITGSIWAKIAWGRWWIWSEDELVLFLVLFLFYCAYFMLRFSVDPGPQRANLSAVYALFGLVLIPSASPRSGLRRRTSTRRSSRSTARTSVVGSSSRTPLRRPRCSSSPTRSIGSSSGASSSTCGCAA
jgi:ABC-type transport system involved in cytochrome c biogenesis permease subunit